MSKPSDGISEFARSVGLNVTPNNGAQNRQQVRYHERSETMLEPATVKRLAEHKRLNDAWLRKRFALRDDSRSRGVIIPYLKRERLRKVVETAHPTKWLGRGEETAYIDEDTLARACERGELGFVEGESDRWTLEAHGIPALGVPGSTMTQCITADHVANLRRVYIIREPDDAGEKFVEHVIARLREVGNAGVVYIVDLQAACGVKDPSDLHVRDPQAFDVQWWRAVAIAERISMTNDDARAQETQPIDWQDTYPWPEPMADEAFYGIAGEFVKIVAPHTEADKHAILANFLSGVSAMIGPKPHLRVGAARQPARINALIIGDTGSGRKGTARDEVERILEIADEKTFHAIRTSGVTSGEGLIRFVRDDVDEDGTARLKRAWTVESEFSRVMAVAKREGSIVSQIIRQAFDSGTLSNLNKERPLNVRGAHVCLSTDCTPDEVRALVTDASIANGFLNRFPLICSKRTRLLPFGGDLSDANLTELGGNLNAAMLAARERGEVRLSEEARPVWRAFYEAYEVMPLPPLLSAAVKRGAQYVQRIALVHALLEGAAEITTAHLEAAIAFWEYSFGSCQHIFGSRLGDPKADALLVHLRDIYDSPMTGTEVDAFFGKNLRPEARQRIRDYLVRHCLVTIEKQPSDSPGRHVELWRARPPGAKSDTEKTDLSTVGAANPFNPYCSDAPEGCATLDDPPEIIVEGTIE